MEDKSTVALITLCGILAYAVSTIFPPFDALFLALVFGMFANSLFKEVISTKIAERFLVLTLPVGITMYGVNVKLNEQIDSAFIIIAVTSTFILGTTVYIASRKIFKLNSKLSILISCGTAICGASAIAVITPLLKPKKEEFSASILLITIVGLTGAIVLPYLYHLLSFPVSKYAVLCGATLPQTGLVEIATRPFGDSVVKSALEVKGVRIALIAIVAFLISVIYTKDHYYVPWYIAAFLIVSYFSSFILSESIVGVLKPLSTLAFSITLASVGFSVNVRNIQNMKFDPLFAAYLGWSIAFLMIFSLVMKI